MEGINVQSVVRNINESGISEVSSINGEWDDTECSYVYDSDSDDDQFGFSRDYEKALMQIEESLQEEDSLEGSVYRVEKLFQLYSTNHVTHRLDPVMPKEDSLRAIDLHDLDETVVKKGGDLEKSFRSFRDEQSLCTKRIYKLNEHFQKLFKAYEDSVGKKSDLEKQLEETVEELNDQIESLNYAIQNKDEKLEGDQFELQLLRKKSTELESLYRKEKRRKQILLKGIGILPGSSKNVLRKLENDESDVEFSDSDWNTVSHWRENSSPGGGPSIQIENPDGEKTPLDSDEERQQNVDNVINQIAEESLKSNDEKRNSDSQYELSYLRFVNGFQLKLDKYETEKILTERQIQDLKDLVRSKDEAMGHHVSHLERLLSKKDEQLIAERDKFRRLFLHQLTREKSTKEQLLTNASTLETSDPPKRRKRSRSIKQQEKDKRRMSTSADESNSDIDHEKKRKRNMAIKIVNRRRKLLGLASPGSPRSGSDIGTSDIEDATPLSPIKHNGEIIRNQAMQDSSSRRRSILRQNEQLKEKYKSKLKEMDQLKKQLKILEKVSKPDVKSTVDGPRGRVILVFTDIQGSTALWGFDVDAMAQGIQTHNKLIRRLLQEFNGYEVKTEGDAFMATFSNPFDSINFALKSQIELLNIDWPEKLFETKEGKIEKDENGKVVWRGLRVRIGLHIGSPLIETDPTTGRLDYFGPVVNKAARIEGCADGGEICVSSDLWEEIEFEFNLGDDSQKLVIHPFVRRVESYQLKGIDGKEVVRALLPFELQNRKFTSIPTPKVDHPVEAASQKNPTNLASKQVSTSSTAVSTNHSVPSKKTNGGDLSNSEVVHNSIQSLKSKIEKLISESQEMQNSIETNSLQVQIAEHEEMIEFLSMEMLSQEEKLLMIENDKVKALKLMKKEIEKKQKEKESDLKRGMTLETKDVKLKYKVNQTDLKQLNHTLKFFKKQTDLTQKKNKDLQYQLIEKQDTIDALRVTIRRLKKEMHIQDQKLKRQKIRSRATNKREKSERSRLAKQESIIKSAQEESEELKPSTAASTSRKKLKKKKVKKVSEADLPRYMQGLKKEVKSDIGSFYNPLFKVVSPSG